MENIQEIQDIINILNQEGHSFNPDFSNDFKFKITNEQINLIKTLLKEKDFCNALKIMKSVIPQTCELNSNIEVVDGIGEENLNAKPTELLTKFYPNRVLLFVTNKCFSNCRFCFRRRKIKNNSNHTKELEESIDFISNNPNIIEVIISGGDPLTLSNEKIENILKNLRSIKHLKVIRIDSKSPISNPKRIDKKLLKIFLKYNVQYLILNIIHAKELTNDALIACNNLIKSEVILGSHTALLKGINDDYDTLKDLFEKLFENRIRPYYLINFIPTKWTTHFWVPIEKGIKLMEQLWGNISGLCTPTFIIYLPNAKGKITYSTDSLVHKKGDIYIFKNYLGEEVEFIDKY